MVEAIDPDFVFAQHFGTYTVTDQNSYWTVGYPDEVCDSLATPFRDRFRIPEQGVVYTIPAD